MIKAAIFDCFGVVYEENFDEVYESFGGDVETDKEFIREIFYKSHTGQITRSSGIFAEKFGVSIAEWESAMDSNRGVDSEMLTYIQNLRKNMTVAMFTNIGSRGIESYIPRDVLDETFNYVFESHVIGFAKPDAHAYEYVADQLGVRCDECVFIDDREYYLEGAQSVGMKTVHFKDIASMKQQLEKILAEK